MRKFKEKLKKLTALSLATAVLVVTIDTSAFADELKAVNYAGVGYGTIAEAISAAEEAGDTTPHIQVQKSMTFTEPIEIKESWNVNISSAEQIALFVEGNFSIPETSELQGVINIAKDATLTLTNMVIAGNTYGEESTSVDNSERHTVEVVNINDGTLVMNSTQIRDFSSDSSAVIMNNSTLIMDTNSRLSRLRYQSVNGTGGAIYATGGCEISGGVIEKGYSYGRGGGIHVAGTEAFVVVTGVTFIQNETNGSGSAIGGTNAYVKDCVFDSNFGGAAICTTLYGEIFNSTFTKTKTDSDYIGGAVEGFAGSVVIGGIRCDGLNGKSAITMSSATGKVLSSGSHTSEKLGIVNTYTNEIINCTNTDGTIFVDLSGTLLIEQADIKGNLAAIGGAVRNRGNLTLNDVTISGNVATEKNALDESITMGNGIYQSGTLTLKSYVNIEDDIYLMPSKEINIAEKPIYHINEQNPIKVVIADTEASENRAVVSYDTKNKEQDAYTAVSSGTFQINYIPDSSFKSISENGKIILTGTIYEQQIECLDNSGNAISNAMFELYRVTNSGEVRLGFTEVSDENGAITIPSLVEGQYYVKVISAPSEYEVNRAEKIYFETGSEKISITLEDADETPVAVIVIDAETVAVNEVVKMDGEYSSDDNSIVEYKWDFGDGSTFIGEEASHSYVKEGTYEIKLEVKDNKGNKSTEKTEIEVKGTLENEYRITANIISSTTGEKIKDAVMVVSSEDGLQAGYVYADADGKAELYAPGGKTYQISVYANGYYQRSTSLYLPMDNREINVYLSDVNTVVGEITVEPMTYEEIVEAGIDVTKEENQNVSRQKVVVEFTTNYNESLYAEIIKYVNSEDEIVKEEIKDTEGYHFEKIDEKFYLAIQHKITWAKEMFNVQLVVMNNSQFEEVENCEAQLILPEGLSLAAMKEEGENQELVSIGNIATGDSAVHNWYVRGDTAGAYHIGAVVTGTLVSESGKENFVREYTTSNAIEVLGGKALLLEIEAETTTYRGDCYNITYKLHNNSEIDIRNLTFALEAEDQYRISKNSDVFLSTDRATTRTVECLEPGDYIQVKTKTYIRFKSEELSDPEYYVKDLVMRSIGGNAEIPVVFTLKYVPARVKPGTHISSTTKESSSADPVDMLTGSFTYQYRDATILGKNELAYERKYSSATAVEGRLGYGWKDSFDYSLVRDEYNNLILSFPNGDNATFYYNQDYSYSAISGSELSMEANYADEVEAASADGIEAYSDDLVRLPSSFIEETRYNTHLVEAEQYIVRDKDGEEYHFDSDYKLIKTVDKDGYDTEYQYDENGKLLKVISLTGSVAFSWNTDNLVSGISMSSGEEITYEYNDNKLLSKVTNGDGDSVTYDYDENNFIRTITDFMGQKSIENTYDKYGRVTKQSVLGEGDYIFTYDDKNKINSCTGENGYVHTIKYNSENLIIEDSESGKSTYTYNGKNQRISEVDSLGNKTSYVYDTSGNVLKIKYADDTTEEFWYNSDNKVTKYKNRNNKYKEYSYDSKNHLISEIDFNGNETIYTYDSYGNIIVETHSDGSIIQYSYDEAGRKVVMTDSNGNTMKYKYDPAGREKSIEDAAGGVITYSYSAAGKLISETDELGNTTYYDVNANGYNTAVTDKNGNKTTTAYNVQNKAVQTVSPLDYINSYEYDKAGNLTKETDPEGNSKQYKYDAFGRITECTDAGGNLWVYTYDELGRVTDIKNPLGDTASSVYDMDGNVISKKDEKGNITEYTYDSEGNILTEKDSLGNLIKYEYDGNGNLVKETDARGNETAYTYDVLNRVTKTENSDGDVWTYTYDTVGNMIQQTDAEGNETKYNYDSMGRVILTTDPKGYEISYTYDVAGNMKTVTYPDGGKFNYTYDANGNMTGIKDQNGFEESYVYDKENRLIEKTDKNGSKTIYGYDGNGNITEETNGLGTEVVKTYNSLGLLATETDTLGTKKYNYDVLGRLSSETSLGGSVTEYAYDKVGNVTSIKDGNGNITLYEYDSVGNVSKITKPDGGIITYEYDADGNVKKETDGEGGVTLYEYDSADRMISKTDAEENVWSWKYDSNGNVTEYTDAEGAITLYEYDRNGNNIKITNVLGYSTIMEYDSMNRLVKTKTHLGFTTSYEYDTNGNLIKETDAVGNVTIYTYDANGNCTSKEKGGIKEGYTYDKDNRLVKIAYADESEESYEYDIHDNVTSYRDKKGSVTLYEYDADGNMVKTTDALGNLTEYEYDAMGNVKKQILHRTENGSVVDEITLYNYDSNNNVTQVTDALGQVTKYEYDLNGNLKVKKDGEGNILEQYSYTKTNLLKEKTDGETILAEYSYNKNGTLIEMVTPETSITYDRDKLDRIIHFNQNNSYDVYYSYDADGRKTMIRYPDNLVGAYGYDGNGSITSVSHAIGMTYYTYDANGNILTKKTEAFDGSTGRNNTESYTYDIYGNVLTSTLTKADGTVVPLDTYIYDIMGNVISHTEQNIQDGSITNKTYTYDVLGRLTSETVTQGEDTSNTAYEYDSIGNMTKEITDAMTVMYEYNNLNQLIKKYNPDGYSYGHYSWGYSYAYDNYGNLTSVTNLVGNQNEYSVSSDSNGKLQSATRNINANGVKEAIITQTYDATGNNIKTNTKKTYIDKQTDITVTRIYDYTEEVPKILAEYGTDGTMKKYIYGAEDERIVASVKTNMVYNFGMKSYTLHSDRLGSTRWATDSDGSIAAETKYSVWGEVTENSGIYISASIEAADITSSYTGYSYDSSLDWWNAGARMYAPQIKRFISKDPIWGNVYEPARVNSYIYAGNNPIVNIDPDGKSFFGEVKKGFQGLMEEVKHTFQKAGCVITKAVSEMSMSQKVLTGLTMMVLGYATGGVSLAAAGTTMLAGIGSGGAISGFGYTVTTSNWNYDDYWNAVLNGMADGTMAGGMGVLTEGVVGTVLKGMSVGSYTNDTVPDNVRAGEGGTSTIKGSDLVFGSSTKSTQKLMNQMNSRGWTEDLIRNTVDNPYTIRTSVNKATGNSATVFYTQQGSYVIVDDVTKAIVQISDNINPSTWAPDLSIVDPYIPD